MSAISFQNDVETRATETAQAAAIEQQRELRVLQVFHGLGMGGAETWLMALLKYFQEQNEVASMKVKFDVLLTGGKEEVFDDEAERLGAHLFYLPFSRRTLPAFIRGFRKILKDGRYDAIHDHQDYIAGLHFAMGAGLLPPVRIAHVHNPFYHRANPTNSMGKGKTNQLGKYFVGRYATHVMGTSRQIVSEYGFDKFEQRVTLGAAHCGIDINRFRGNRADVHAELCREFGWDNSARILLFVGRLDGAEFVYHGKLMTHKNPTVALQIARICIASDKETKLLVVGEGETKQHEFQSLVDEWRLGDAIKLLGKRLDVPRLMIGSDLLLFPSVAEGLGMVVVEAQAAGLPVLASDTTPKETSVIPELIKHMSLDAEPREWAQQALTILADRKEQNESANEAVKASAFSIEQSAHRLTALYGRKILVNE